PVPLSEPRPATEARPDVLLELVHGVRGSLLARGEAISSVWVEEAARDLKAGRQLGWTLGEGSLAFVSTRPARTFGHVHVGEGADRLERAETLLAVLVAHLPPGTSRLDAGVSGLTDEEEETLAERYLRLEGASILRRARMERNFPPPPPDLPPGSLGIRHVRARSLPVDALAELDWRAFRGTPDENLVADTAEENRQTLADVLNGRLGRFVDEASTALVQDDGALVGALLTAEHDPRTGVFLDLLVEPSHRRRGLGRYLVSWGLRALSALGYSTARLWVTETNRPAWLLYLSVGFEVVGRARIFRYVAPTALASPHPHSAL
ncbi:MAG TPA: GNAT family N-acetyltransferase, partial [Thermoplasmata archaeon]|nr:GNAT family N-acetyltransferase [Thermoplasmata archaeon]